MASFIWYINNSNRILPVNSILLCCTASVGEYAIAKIPLTTNQQFNGLAIKEEYKELFYYRFLYHIASTFKDTLIRMAGKTTFNFISVKKVSSILIPFPPFNEQHRIVAKIEELLPYVEKYGKTEENLTALNNTFPETLKKSILQEAVQGKLVPQNPDDEPASVLLERIKAEKQKLIKEGKIKKEKPLAPITEEEIPFDIPESWEWCRLGEVVLDVTDGPHFSPKYQDNGIPFISTRNIVSGKIDFSTAKYITPELHNELCKRCKPKKLDILYSKGGTTGIAVVNDSDIEFNVWVHVAVLSMSSCIYPYYLAMALNSPHCFELSQKYTHGTGNRDLGLTRMVKITIPLPPLEEQKRIVAKIEELTKYCDKL